MTKAEIAKLKRLRNKAVSGKDVWKVQNNGSFDGYQIVTAESTETMYMEVPNDEDDGTDVRYIAALHNAFDELIEAAERDAERLEAES